MKKVLLIYASYLAILAFIVFAVNVFGLSAKAGLWIAVLVAAVYMIFWPRW